MNQASEQLHQKHTVKVNDGSGVLIQPLSPDYAYVLTARHCLLEDKDDLSSAVKPSHTVFTFDETELSIFGVINHKSKDIAILIVDPQPQLEQLMINCDPLQVNELLRLCGFPENRQDQDEKYSSIPFKFVEPLRERLIFSPDLTGVTADNILGFSGGGFFTLGGSDSAILLCAIETKMAGNIVREYHSNVSAIPISEFEQFIADSQYLDKPLAQLLPLHLSSFDHLLEFSFNVIRDWSDLDGLSLVQDCLRDVATERVISVNLAPHEILAEFKTLLKVHNRPAHESQSREMWVSLLELLIVSILIDKPATIDLAYVETILKSRRLMYIDAAGSWREYLKEILLSELAGLNENGIIVTKTKATTGKPCYTQAFLKKAWEKSHIGRAAGDPRSIKIVNKHIAKIHRVVDLAALHTTCIAGKEDAYEDCIVEFDDVKEVTLLARLAQAYGTFLTVKAVTDEN